MKRHSSKILGILLLILFNFPVQVFSDDVPAEVPAERKDHTEHVLFDDRYMLEGRAEEFAREPKEVIQAMLRDDALDHMKMAAAVRVLREKHIATMLRREKIITEKYLLRRLNRSESPFVEIEVMHTLCQLDRYQYFAALVPDLIQKMEHYNSTISNLAYEAIDSLIHNSSKTREARYVFNTLRKNLFLSRKRLENMTEPDKRLSQKLKLLRWSIKILGTQELNRLPKEVIHLL